NEVRAEHGPAFRVLALHRGEYRRQLADRRAARALGGEEGSSAFSDLTGLAPGAEAVGRSDPGYAQHGSPEGELRSTRCSADAGRAGRAQDCVLQAYRARRPHV